MPGFVIPSYGSGYGFGRPITVPPDPEHGIETQQNLGKINADQ
jgi:hypothetical protein